MTRLRILPGKFSAVIDIEIVIKLKCDTQR